jgi:uncharacterized membrane protein
MDLSFQEKSLWLVFVSLIASFGLYAMVGVVPMLPLTGARDVMPQQVVLFALAVGVLVIAQIVGHVVIAIVDRQEQTDERDRLIAMTGVRNGSYVLATGVFTALCVAVGTEGNFLFTHVLLAFWVLAQLVETGTQLFLYRRDA